MKITILALLVAVTPQMRAAINRTFRPDDFEVVWTANPSEAATASAQHHLDLLLLDLDPRSAGSQRVFENLKTANPDARVVVLTEYKAAREGAIRGTADVVIEKPFDIAELADTVHELFKTPVTDAERCRAIEAAGKFREKLWLRANTPLAIPTPYQRWGLNE